ncbi:MAG: hypothetical protein G01um101416_1011 [Microgenomates group bacterium Gr01-1014_16]|nr:MAG: hypothetical protein G01um101416_1011 [Microgenomates group bacterium Gr01-1014_16]
MTPGQKAKADLEEITRNAAPNLADEVEEFEEKQHDWQAAYDAGGPFKERLEAVVKERHMEKPVEKVIEIPTTPEVGPEVEGYMEKVEKEAEMLGPVMDDYTAQVLLKPKQKADKQALPLTDEEIKEGLHHKVWEAIRWLATWCMRQVQKLQGGGV